MTSDDDNLSNKRESVVNKTQEDLTALTKIFSLPALSYVDIDLEERLAKISTRWPLIVELTKVKS